MAQVRFLALGGALLALLGALVANASVLKLTTNDFDKVSS